jgi:hypothetical protein
MWRVVSATITNAADCESDHAAGQRCDTGRDAQRHEWMPSDLNGGFRRAVLDRMASSDDSPSNVPYVFVDSCPDGFRTLPDGFGRGIDHSCHGFLR